MSSVRSLRGSARLLALRALAGSAALAMSTAIPAPAAPADSAAPAAAPAAVTAPRTAERPVLDVTALTVGSWTRTQATAHRVQAGLSAKEAAAKAKAAKTKAAAARAAASGDPRTIAKAMLGQFQWRASQFSYLDKLWFHESGWEVAATNPGSGAYGIPQSLPASQMASAGPDWRTNPATQVKWGLTYIHERYGTPSGAWAHEQSHNWY